jgi:hypothetical protein
VASRWRDLGTLATCVVVGWLVLGATPRLPGLAVVDLGFASLGHAAGEAVDAVLPATILPAAAGLLAPAAVPLALAWRFLLSRRERHAGALCLVWAAAVLTALAVAAGEAAGPGPAGAGAPSDWAVLLGPPGPRALDRTAEVVGALRGGAVVLLTAAVAVCAAPLVPGGRRALAPSDPPAATWSGPNRRRV